MPAKSIINSYIHKIFIEISNLKEKSRKEILACNLRKKSFLCFYRCIFISAAIGVFIFFQKGAFPGLKRRFQVEKGRGLICAFGTYEHD